MNKHLRLTTLIAASSLMLASCVNKDYSLLNGNIDYTIGADMTLVGPAAHSNIKLYEPLPESFNSFKFRVDGDEVYLCKQDTQHLGNDIIGHLKMYPKGTFTKELTLKTSVEAPLIGIIDEDLTYEFPDINTNPNERLDSILYKENQTLVVQFTSTVTPVAGSYLEVSADPAEVSLDPAKYPDNKLKFSIDGTTTQLDVDFSKAIVKFVGGKKFTLKLNGEIKTSSTVPAGSKVTFTTKFDNLQPRITLGYLGPDRVIYEATKKIPFAYTKDLQGTDFFMPFYNPVIYLDAINSIGIPAQYELDYVGLAYLNESGVRDTVYAEFDGSKGTKFKLEYPTPAEIEGLDRNQLIAFNTPSIEKKSSFKLDRDFGHTERLFQVRGDTMVYHYKIRPLEVDGKNVAYFFDDSNIDIALDAEMNLRFQGNSEDASKNFYIDRYDTLKINFNDLKVDESKLGGLKLNDSIAARVKLDFINHLPVDADATYWLVNKEYEEIMSSKKGTVNVQAPQVDATGVVTQQSVETNAYVKFTYEEWKKLTEEGAGIILKYKIINKELKDVWFKSNDWIDLTAEVWAKGFIVYNPKEGGEK